MSSLTLHWRHNKRCGVSNHQHHHCLLNRLFRSRSKKTSKLRVTGLCAGNSPVTGEFPAQMVSNTEMFPFDDVIKKTARGRDMRSGIQLAGITLLWLAGLNIGWDCLSPSGLRAHLTGRNFYSFSEIIDSRTSVRLVLCKGMWKSLCAMLNNISVSTKKWWFQFELIVPWIHIKYWKNNFKLLFLPVHLAYFVHLFIYSSNYLFSFRLIKLGWTSNHEST